MQFSKSCRYAGRAPERMQARPSILMMQSRSVYNSTASMRRRADRLAWTPPAPNIAAVNRALLPWTSSLTPAARPCARRKARAETVSWRRACAPMARTSAPGWSAMATPWTGRNIARGDMPASRERRRLRVPASGLASSRGRASFAKRGAIDLGGSRNRPSYAESMNRE